MNGILKFKDISPHTCEKPRPEGRGWIAGFRCVLRRNILFNQLNRHTAATPRKIARTPQHTLIVPPVQAPKVLRNTP